MQFGEPRRTDRHTEYSPTFGAWYIRKRAAALLLLLAVFFLLLLFGSSYFLVAQMMKDVVHDEIDASANLLKEEIQRERANMKDRLALILENRELLDTFAVHNRDALAHKAEPLMQSLRKKGFTHLYFIDSDLRVFYRAHQPSRYGDKLKRQTARKAKIFARSSAGIELGPLGTLTFRMVRPVIKGGNIIGFIELGKELPVILEHIARTLDVSVVIALNKQKLEGSFWREGVALNSYNYPWAMLNDYALSNLDQSLDVGALQPLLRDVLEDDKKDWFHAGDSYLAAAKTVLMDVNQRPIGYLVIVRHVDHLVAMFWKNMRLSAALVLFLGMLAVGVIVVLLARADRQLHSYHVDLEREVAQRTSELAQANHELESFAYAVSHDLRAPLRSMDGFATALQEDYAAALNDEAAHYLERIRAGSRRMGEMIDALLRLSRVSRRDMKFERVDLSELCTKALQRLHDQEPERQVVSEVQSGVEVVGDWMLLSVCLENLVSNAWKFTKGCMPARIEFAAEKRQDELIFWLRDNGAGFDPAYADKLFGAFQRLHTQDEFEGIGIGLATVQRIVSRHGGRIWAEGTPGKGAVFFCAFPLAEVGGKT